MFILQKKELGRLGRPMIGLKDEGKTQFSEVVHRVWTKEPKKTGEGAVEGSQAEDPTGGTLLTRDFPRIV